MSLHKKGSFPKTHIQFFIIFFSFFIASGVKATHVSCGSTLTTDTTLDSDLNCSEGNGLTFGEDNIILDCKGFSIFGTENPVIPTNTVGIKAERVISPIVQNCGVYGFVHGIRFLEVSQGSIHNNEVSSNAFNGIVVSVSDSVVVDNNQAENSISGIFSRGTSRSIFENNVVEFIEYNGIDIGGESNMVRKNMVKSSGIGIYVFYRSKNNILEENEIFSNREGVRLDGTDNTIRSNVIRDNTDYGLWFGACCTDLLYENNIIYNNKFINNTLQAQDLYYKNIWNIEKTVGENIIGGDYLGGNYWSDYRGIDSNGDGLGDTGLPYTSRGEIKNGGDFLPLIDGESQCTRVPVDVVFAIDSSGSMTSTDPNDLRQVAAEALVDKLNPTIDRASVVSWDDGLDLTIPLTNDFAFIKEALDIIDSDGGTNIDTGLLGSIDELQEHGRPEAKRIILFLTDGGGSYTPSGQHGSPADLAQQLGITVYTIGLTVAPGSIVEGMLQEIAVVTDGIYFSSPGADNLVEVFTLVSPHLCTEKLGPYICGNNKQEFFEECDGQDLSSKSCSDLGYDGGPLSCLTSCNFDATQCTYCGNNIIEVGEECDDDNRLNGDGCSATCKVELGFRRSDSNGDGGVDISDGIYTLGWLFLGTAGPLCLDAADANDSGGIDLSDAVYTFAWLFSGGTIPPLPGPFTVGVDPTASDPLTCAQYPAPQGGGAGGSMDSASSPPSVKEAAEAIDKSTQDQQTKDNFKNVLNIVPKGTLSASSDPTGAYFYLDGKYKGYTGSNSITINNLYEGSYTAKFIKYNYEIYQTAIKILPGQTTIIKPTLKSLASPSPTPTPSPSSSPAPSPSYR